MKYWDSSALVPLCVEESSSPVMRELYGADPVIITWWGSELECVSALARLEREGVLSAAMMSAAVGRLGALRSAWHEIQPSQAVRDTATRLLRTHPLRAADAVQLASAIVASDHRPAAIGLVTLDARLAVSARREGFTALGSTEPA